MDDEKRRSELRPFGLCRIDPRGAMKQAGHMGVGESLGANVVVLQDYEQPPRHIRPLRASGGAAESAADRPLRADWLTREERETALGKGVGGC